VHTEARVRILIANVRYENDDSAALRELVEQASPDVVLVTEPGRWWERELAPIERGLPHVIRQPQEDTWGMLLYSRLPLIEPGVRFLVEPDIPSIRTRLQLDSGDQIWLYGMHPRPPVPGQDTDERDTELVMVGKELRTRGAPAILTGDLNDVAWSATTGQLLEIGDLRDPRIGRGPFSTFDATMPSWFRWPLDYVFYTRHFDLCRLQLLDDIGSDHVPLLAEAVLRGNP
jgi:endonuclease/exonuclease/phosphatase (EEP) superfamily protein YafD